MSQPRILIVEDELLVARELSLQLSGWGYEVIGVTDRGDEAIRLADELRPDLVLMDIRLRGEMDGVTAAQTIREHIHRPVLYLTAYLDDQTTLRAKKTLPAGVMFKPYEIDALLTAIEGALDETPDFSRF